MATNKDAHSGDSGLLADYLTEDELAAEFGVTRKTIRNWRALGEAPLVTRIGRKIFYAQTDVQKWLQSQRVEQPP